MNKNRLKQNIDKLHNLIKQSHYIDLSIRKDGQTKLHEADFLWNIVKAYKYDGFWYNLKRKIKLLKYYFQKVDCMDESCDHSVPRSNATSTIKDSITKS